MITVPESLSVLLHGLGGQLLGLACSKIDGQKVCKKNAMLNEHKESNSKKKPDDNLEILFFVYNNLLINGEDIAQP